MKVLILIFLAIFCFCFLVHPADAHINGQSVFKINGRNTIVEPVKNLRSIDELQDIAPEEHGINQTLTFEVEIAKYPTPKNIFERTNFIWDFADGTGKQTIKYGFKNTHIYSKEGQYLITVYADYKSAGFTLEPQLLQSVIIHINSKILQGKSEQNTLSQTVQNTQNKQEGLSQLFLYLFPAIIVGIGIYIYFFLIRKSKRRKKVTNRKST